MNEQFRQEIRDYVSAFHLPRYRELPDFGLRLEQVIRYVGRYVPGAMTGSMVSNYVKQKLIPGPTKKAYGRESLAYLFFVFYIKTVMPMEDIHAMIEVQKSSYPIDVAYDYFCEEFENLLQYVGGLKEQPDHIGRSHSPQKELLRTALLSITYRVYLDQLLRFIRSNPEQMQ